MLRRGQGLVLTAAFVFLCGKQRTQLAVLFMVPLNRGSTVQRANDLSDGVCIDLAQCIG